MTTPRITISPNTRLNWFCGRTASSAAAGSVPTTRPASAQPTPPRSMPRRSRTVNIRVNTMVDASTGPGTSLGSIRMRIGVPRMPMP